MLRLSPLLLLTLIGCASGASGSSADAFVNACLASTNWDQEMCECAEGRAREDLTGTTYAFLVASMGDDDTETARLRDDLSFTEATEGGLFMIGAATACAAANAP